jgi:TPR repeat protein
MRTLSSAWTGLGLVSVATIATACSGYVVRPRSHFAVAQSAASARVTWCATDPDACRVACEGGDVSACNVLGAQLELGTATGVHAPEDAAVAYAIGCDGDYPPSCTNLGWLVLRGRGVLQDAPLALVLFQRAYDGYARACTAGSGASCMSALDTMPLLDPRDDEDVVTVALLERACELGETRACDELDR